MRFLLLAFLSVLVSCGQNSSSKSASEEGPQREEDYVTDIREVDLLDVAMDVPVQITGNQIIFQRAANESVTGVRVSCSLGVASGEIYNYQLSGNRLTIKTASGQKMNLTRVSGAANSIIGSWTGSGREGEMLVMRRVTFVTDTRLVMRTHCES